MLACRIGENHGIKLAEFQIHSILLRCKADDSPMAVSLHHVIKLLDQVLKAFNPRFETPPDDVLIFIH